MGCALTTKHHSLKNEGTSETRSVVGEPQRRQAERKTADPEGQTLPGPPRGTRQAGVRRDGRRWARGRGVLCSGDRASPWNDAQGRETVVVRGVQRGEARVPPTCKLKAATMTRFVPGVSTGQRRGRAGTLQPLLRRQLSKRHAAGTPEPGPPPIHAGVPSPTGPVYVSR